MTRAERAAPLGRRWPPVRVGPWWVVAVLAGAYVLVGIVDDARIRLASPTSDGRLAAVLGATVAMLACLSLLPRRPRWAAGAGAAALVLSVLAWQVPIGFLCVFAVLFTLALRDDRTAFGLAAVGALAWGAVVGMNRPVAAPALAWVVLPFAAAVSALGFVVGSAVRRRRQAELRVATVEAVAAGARDRERRLLARELHDVVAHELTLIAMQASVMRVAPDPGRVEEARAVVERTSRDALDELQRLLTVLRTGDAALDAAAVPLAPVVDELADELRALGHDVTAHCDVPDLPRSVELAADRVLREAVTNIVKHAGAGVACELRADVGDGVLRLEVANDVGGGARPALPSSGTGVRGLAERLRDVGGSIDAGLEGGARGARWVVRARVPVAAETG